MLNAIYKCIESIIHQTYRSIQLIHVGDGSVDGSPAICDRYVCADKRMQVIHKINEGVSVARNVGLEASIENL